ncbi:MAG TPA: iron ABC transporter permease [Jatrophihabitantaceae bacterium]|jgi:iron(III) transport system permease protein
MTDLVTAPEATRDEAPAPDEGRRRRTRIEWRTPNALFVVLLVVLGALVAIPFVYLVRSAFQVDIGPNEGAATTQNFADIVSGTGDLWHLALNSVIFALGSALVSMPIGTVLAWIAERTDTPLRSFAYVSAYAGLAVPGVITVIGWILLLGPQNGILNVWLEQLFGTSSPPFDLFSMPGMILVHGLQSVPVVFLLMVGPFRSNDASMQEAAAMSGANPLATFFRITARLSKPTVLAVLLLNVVTSLESFETPALIGIPGGVKVLTTQVYLNISSALRPRYGLSAAYGLVLIAFVSIALWYYTYTTRQAGKYVTVSGKGVRPRKVELGRWRWLTAFLVILLPIVLLLPLLVMLWAALLPRYEIPSWSALHSVTLDNFSNLVHNHDIYTSLLNSLEVGVTAALASVLLSAMAAWVVVRTSIRFRSALEYVVTAPLVFPGVVLGVALLQAYLDLPIPVYGTLWILVIAFCVKYIPYGMRFSSPALLQIGRELEEAASMSGAGWFRTFFKVVLPLMAASLTGAFIYIFLLSMKELSVALLLYTPGTQLVSVQIYTLWTQGEIPELASFGVFVTVLLMLVALAFRRLTARFGLRQAA